jgi:hypothetical protein
MASPPTSMTTGKAGAALAEANGSGEDFLQYAPADTMAALLRQLQLAESKRILGDSGGLPDDLKLWTPRRRSGA